MAQFCFMSALGMFRVRCGAQRAAWHIVAAKRLPHKICEDWNSLVLSKVVKGLDADVHLIQQQASSVHVGDTDSEWLLRHAKAAHLPLVLMSGSGSQGEVMKGIELGAVDYLEKPVSLQKLRNIWQHVVRKVSVTCPHCTSLLSASLFMTLSFPACWYSSERCCFCLCPPQMMLSGGVPEDQKPCCSMKVEAPAALPPAKAVAAASGPSPAASGEEPVHSTHTGHSSKCSEAEASSCSEVRCCRTTAADTAVFA